MLFSILIVLDLAPPHPLGFKYFLIVAYVNVVPSSVVNCFVAHLS